MRLTRAAFLPFCGDPFLLKYFLKYFNEVWRDEIDHLYIYLNADLPEDVLEYTYSLVDGDPEITAMGSPRKIDHGPAIDKMLEQCREDLVMLVEEDAIIFKQGIVDYCFRLIEEDRFDIVGSARGSCSFEIIEAAKKLWGTGDDGPNFWPNFFFCKRDDLLRTNRHFHAKSWNRDDYIKELDYTIKDEIAPSDTFGWASLQLRAMGLRVKLIDQYHGSPDDLIHKTQRYNIFDGKCPWFHVGSLSGWKDVLMGDLQPKVGANTEWERRVQFWKTFYDESDPLAIHEFRATYKLGIDRIIKEYDLSLPAVEERQRVYKDMMSDEMPYEPKD